MTLDPVTSKRGGASPVRLRFEQLEERRLLVVAVSGDPNDTWQSLDSYGGPGDPSLPGFNNVGRSSTGNASVVYLGGGWVLTAKHVTIANPPGVLPGGVFFGANQYLIDTSTIHQLHDPILGGLADLQIFKIIGAPEGVATILPGYLAAAPPPVAPDPDSHVYMIGNGLTRGAQHSWHVDMSQSPWKWTEEPPVNYVGYDVISPRRIRWGENQVDANGLYYDFGSESIRAFITQFNTPSLTHEAQATSGDSGGPALLYDGDKWVVSGIMIGTNGPLSGQPLPTVLLDEDFTALADLSYYRDEILSIAGVMGRHVFYNASTFDANTPGASASDDGAIATDKVAYLPLSGVVAGSANATSYVRGINGIMVDLASNHGPLSLDDFRFHVGANNTPGTWAAAPDPIDFTVRPGAGPGNSDRVEIIWADGAIVNTWLEVTVEGNDASGGFNVNTGLAASDVFYFGNRIGDTFSNTPAAVLPTTATDEIETRANIGFGATVTNLYDFDRNGAVNASDQIITRGNIGFTSRINISSPPAAPAAAGEADAPALSAVTFALGSSPGAHELPPEVPRSLPLPPRTVDEGRSSRERVFAQWALAADDPWLDESDDDLDSARGEGTLAATIGLARPGSPSSVHRTL